MCFFCKCWDSSQKSSESRVMKYDSNIRCFFVCYYPKIHVNVEFNSFNSPQILPAEWWDFVFFGGMLIPTLFPGFSLSRYIRCFKCLRHFVRCRLKTFCFHPLDFHRPRLDFRKISWAQFENEVKDWGWANGGIKKIFQHLDRHLPAAAGGAGNPKKTGVD